MKPNTESANFAELFEQMESDSSAFYTRTIQLRGRNPKYNKASNDILERLQQTKKLGETELDLSHMNLAELPDELFELTALTTLDISYNQLKEIPAAISKLTKLNTLICSNNPIEKVSDQVRDLKGLLMLQLHNCKLTAFPKGILQLKALQTLNLSDNQIKWIPAGLKDLEKLEEIELQNNPILNLGKQFHYTTSARLFTYYQDIASSADMEGPLMLSVYMEPANEATNVEGDRIGEFNPLTEKLITESKFTSRSVINPDGQWLYNNLYKNLKILKILFVLAEQLTQVRSPEGEMQSITPEDFSEMFLCLPHLNLETRLLILDFQNGWSIAENFTSQDFNIILSRNNGTEVSKETLPNFFKNLLGDNSLAFCISEMWKGDLREYRLSYSAVTDFESLFHSNLLGAKAANNIDTKAFRDLALLHVLADLYPTRELALTIVTAAGLKATNISFSSTPETNWLSILDEAKKENKTSQLLDAATKEYPTISKLIDPLFAQPSTRNQKKPGRNTRSTKLQVPGKHKDPVPTKHSLLSKIYAVHYIN